MHGRVGKRQLLNGHRRFAVAAAALVLVAAACGDSDDIDVSNPSDAPTTSAGTADEAAAVPVTTTAATPECPPETGADGVTQQFAAAPPFCLDPDATYSALVETSTGDITIELDQVAAPQAVNSFVFLARNNYFDDTVCHRVVKDFVVQCGDPTATGTGGPGYRFADELPAEGSYELGSIAMANSGPDTNGSQFFIISGPNGVALPPLYSLFGQVPEADFGVVADMDALASPDGNSVPTEEIRILDVTITQS
jgi:cyclophilin family peptidyl-prolyl cis-trans isomerase